MIKNFFKTAFRNILKSRISSAVNIIGLAIALAGFIVVLVYLNYELSYDKWDPALANVFKISYQDKNNILETTPAPLASFIKEKYPNAEAATAIMASGDFEYLLSIGEEKFYQDGVVTADSLFLQVFPYKLSKGDASVALNRPEAALLSEELSKKLFGSQDPMGKTIRVFNSWDVIVTGIFKTPSTPVHLKTSLLMRDRFEKQNKFWNNFSFQTYIKTKTPISVKLLEGEINPIYYDAQLKEKNISYADYRKAGNQTGLFADAIADIHNFPKHGETNFKTTIILLLLAAFLLIAGAFNFSNLSVAKAITRAKEVGIRKVMGSRKRQIIIQSLLEIVLQCAVSTVLALALASSMLPWFNNSFGLPLSLFSGSDSSSVFGQLLLALVIVIMIAGLYPAILLSKYKISEAVKGNYNSGKKGSAFKNSLLIGQLVLSAFFLTALLVVNKQMRFMEKSDLGFKGNQVMRINATQPSREQKFESVRTQLLEVPGVEYVSKTTSVPGDQYVDTSTVEFKFEGELVRLNAVRIGVDYFKTIDIPLLQGRLFDNNRIEDKDNTAIINESASKRLGLKSPIGKQIYFPFCDSIPYTIVGVVKDFNVQGMENKIVPSLYSVSNAHCGYRSGGAILVKINSARMEQAVAGIESAWKKIEPAFPIRYTFLDQHFQKVFTKHRMLSRLIFFYTALSIFITVIGLFALTAFLAQQRTKEIGIRKTLGASVGNLTVLLSKRFVLLACIAVVIAIPIAALALQSWLNGFAYKTTIDWWVFGLAAVGTMVITLIAVSFQSIKAALMNPVDSLRSE